MSSSAPPPANDKGKSLVFNWPSLALHLIMWKRNHGSDSYGLLHRLVALISKDIIVVLLNNLGNVYDLTHAKPNMRKMTEIKSFGNKNN